MPLYFQLSFEGNLISLRLKKLVKITDTGAVIRDMRRSSNDIAAAVVHTKCTRGYSYFINNPIHMIS